MDLSNYNLDSLRALYEKESEVLQSRLLNGELWDEVRDLRVRVTELSIALHQKLQSDKGANPAESFSFRGEGRSIHLNKKL